MVDLLSVDIKYFEMDQEIARQVMNESSMGDTLNLEFLRKIVYDKFIHGAVISVHRQPQHQVRYGLGVKDV